MSTIQQMQKYRKAIYTVIMGSLTGIAMTACYWQTKKYFLSSARWETIWQELSLNKPSNIGSISDNELDELFPFKYVAVNGELSSDHIKVIRNKNGRRGYVVIRSIKYQREGKDQSILVMDGWCPKGYKHQAKAETKNIQGFIKEKQKIDYGQAYKVSQKQTNKMYNYINLEQFSQKFKMQKNKLNQQYYIEILRPLNIQNENDYPYQYSVDNFQMPYLTPDKHRAYGLFWFTATIAGAFSIYKVLLE